MNLVLRIPDAVAARLAEGGPDLERQALEAFVLESFRTGRISKAELREMLGFSVINEVDGFLKAHDIYEPYDEDELQRDRETFTKLGI